MPQFLEWQRGNPLTAEHLNEPARYLNNHGPLVAGPGLGSYASSGMTAVGPVGRRALNGKWFLGQVTDQGPNGEADYDDGTPLYWVKCLYMKPTGDDTTEPDLNTDTSCFGLLKDDPDPSDDDDTSSQPNYINIVTVSNLAECNPDNPDQEVARLAKGQTVYVWQEFEQQKFVDTDAGDDDSDPDPVVRWVTFTVPQLDYWVGLSNPTGDNGVAGTSAPTFTYDIRDHFADGGGGDPLDTGVEVLMARGSYKVATGTYGLARKATPDGDWKLLWVDETPDLKKYTVVTSITCTGDGGLTYETTDIWGYQ